LTATNVLPASTPRATASADHQRFRPRTTYSGLVSGRYVAGQVNNPTSCTSLTSSRPALLTSTVSFMRASSHRICMARGLNGPDMKRTPLGTKRSLSSAPVGTHTVECGARDDEILP